MHVDENHFRSLLEEVIDENKFGSRALLRICRVEFTTEVPSLCVTLGRHSTLRVNLPFVCGVCRTEAHVKALIYHELLHIVLGHTLRFRSMSRSLNIALDAIINSIIHRQLGADFSSLMADYYGEETGVHRILRPPTEIERRRAHDFQLGRLDRGEHPAESELALLHEAIYAGSLVSDDILDVVRGLQTQGLLDALANGRILLGGHDDRPCSLDDLEPDLARRLGDAVARIPSAGIWRKSNRPASRRTLSTAASSPSLASWRRIIHQLFRRLSLPDRSARHIEHTPASWVLPVPSPTDRRAHLRSLWNPLMGEYRWNGAANRPAGSVQIYLDVSASMDEYLSRIVSLLAGVDHLIRRPLWAFSTEVVPARLQHGRVIAKTTGGTELEPVIKHLALTRAKKALLITDGFVGKASTDNLPCCVEALITPRGCTTELEASGIPCTVLPDLAL